MKKFLLLIMLSASLLSLTGCFGTPGYACGFPDLGGIDTRCTGEHWNRIIRNQRYEGLQIIDDLDHAALLDPPSRSTIWNVR